MSAAPSALVQAEVEAGSRRWAQEYQAALAGRLSAILEEDGALWASTDAWLEQVVAELASFVASGGKRLRPMFCAFGYAAAGGVGQPSQLVDLGCALELLHAFALLHDDVMDGSPTRRGQACAHRRLAAEHQESGLRGEPRRYGEGIAILVGDYSFALAQRLVGAAPLTVSQTWHALCSELVMGQYLDIKGSAQGGVEAPRALRIARYKSGAYTVERPLQLGAALAGGPSGPGFSFTAFARPLGQAFQLRDDILGVFGQPGQTGKPAGDDLRDAKPTLLLSLARQLAPAGKQRLLDRIGCPDMTDDEVVAARQLMVECGAKREIEQLIGRFYHQALCGLDDIPLDASIRPSLKRFAAKALWRTA